jgi:glycerol uptake facilitator-like aquaporin
VLDRHWQGLLQIGISLTFGWTIIVIAWSIGHISGGHLNFAVTFSFILLRKITVLRGMRLTETLLRTNRLILATPRSRCLFRSFHSFLFVSLFITTTGIMYFFGQFFGGLVGIGLLKSVTPNKFFPVRRSQIVYFFCPGTTCYVCTIALLM